MQDQSLCCWILQQLFSADLPDWLPQAFVTFLASTAVVMLGWKVVYWNGLRLANRNETGSIVNDLKSILDACEKMAIDYYSTHTDERNPAIFEQQARAKILQIKFKAELLGKRGVKVDSKDIRRLKQALMMELMADGNDAISCLDKMIDASHTLERTMRDSFENRHPPNARFL